MKKNESTFYTCPYCGKEYSNPVDLAHCILSCEEIERKAAEEEKKKKLEAEKETRYKEIEESITHTKALISSFVKDYGKISLSSSKDDAYKYLWNKLFM